MSSPSPNKAGRREKPIAIQLLDKISKGFDSSKPLQNEYQVSAHLLLHMQLGWPSTWRPAVRQFEKSSSILSFSAAPPPPPLPH